MRTVGDRRAETFGVRVDWHAGSEISLLESFGVAMSRNVEPLANRRIACGKRHHVDVRAHDAAFM